MDVDMLPHILPSSMPLTSMTEEFSVIMASLSGAQIIALIAEHCAEGFYADPRQGGNIDMVSWRMIGFEERR
jgi:hypothetical protein